MATKKQQTPANAAQSDETDVQAPSRRRHHHHLGRPIWGINETREQFDTRIAEYTAHRDATIKAGN